MSTVYEHIFCIVKQKNLQILQYSQINHLNSTKLLTCRNDRHAACFFFLFLRIPHNTDKPLRVVMIAGASTGQGPLILWDSQVTSACKTDCGPDLRLYFGLCNNHDVPYAQAVKLHTLVFCSVQSEVHVTIERKEYKIFFFQILPYCKILLAIILRSREFKWYCHKFNTFCEENKIIISSWIIEFKLLK